MVHHKTPALLTAAIVVLGVAVLANASMEPNGDRRLSYTGHLESGSGPAQGAHDFRFALFASQPSDVDLDCLLAATPNCSLWVEQLDAVDVQSGTFAVELGTQTALTDTMLGQSALWLGVAVKDSSSGAYSKLGGSQRLVPAAFASRAAAAKDFKVTGTLDAQGDVYVGQDLDVTGDAHTDQYLSVQQGADFLCSNCGSTSTLRGNANWGRLTVQGRVLSASGNLHLSPPTGANVVINDTYRAAGGADTGAAGLDVEGHTQLRSSLDVDGWANVDGDFSRGCPGGMNKNGSTCIDANVRWGTNTISWLGVAEGCQNAGLRMCTPAEVAGATRNWRTARVDWSQGDVWVWVDSNEHGTGCHVNLNTNQPGYTHGQVNCQVGFNTNHGAIGGLCCK